MSRSARMASRRADQERRVSAIGKPDCMVRFCHPSDVLRDHLLDLVRSCFLLDATAMIFPALGGFDVVPMILAENDFSANSAESIVSC